MNFKRISQKIAMYTIFGVAALVVFTIVMSALSADSGYSASAEDSDDAIHIYVDGGMMSEPYYRFYLNDDGSSEITELDVGNSYTFHRLNEATSHPFYIGDQGYKTDSSDKITLTGDGSSSSGITGSQSFTLNFNEGFDLSEDILSYFCTVHSSMYADFDLTETIEPVEDDIPTVAQGTGVHTALVAAVIQAGLLETLQGDGPFTVFAPTDDAFLAAGVNLSALDNDEGKAVLTDILLYHVVSGSVMSSEVTDGMTATAINGDTLTFSVGDSVMVNDATVTIADVTASNGVVHVIDKVLMPPVDEDDIPTVAQETGVHTALVAAVIQAGLLETLQGDGPFTVFAPTDDAFLAAGVDLSALDNDEGKAALTNILLYHVVSGSVMSSEVTDGMTATAINGGTLTFSVGDSVMVNDATVTIADVTASNGVVHVIDKVLMPPVPGEICYDMATHTVDVTKTVETCDKSWIPSVDIPMTAAATTIHSSLVAALDKANLTATLKGTGPFTVFAPTDEAFAAAGIDLAEFDTDEEISSLADILTYHVVSGKVMSSDLTDGMEAKAINGDVLKFMIGENVTVNSATITIADVPVSNGIIHVIDKVLMPPADELEPEQPTCDFTVGLDSSGYAFSPASISIEVGDTVCWQWTDSMDSHNVAEISNEGDVTRKEGGIYSGAVATTVDFRHTFEEATTFYYICEPHVSMEMVGKVIVGDGGATTDIVDETEEVEDEESSTPSIGLLAGIVAMLGVALVARKL